MAMRTLAWLSAILLLAPSGHVHGVALKEEAVELARFEPDSTDSSKSEGIDQSKQQGGGQCRFEFVVPDEHGACGRSTRAADIRFLEVKAEVDRVRLQYVAQNSVVQEQLARFETKVKDVVSKVAELQRLVQINPGGAGSGPAAGAGNAGGQGGDVTSLKKELADTKDFFMRATHGIHSRLFNLSQSFLRDAVEQGKVQAAFQSQLLSEASHRGDISRDLATLQGDVRTATSRLDGTVTRLDQQKAGLDGLQHDFVDVAARQNATLTSLKDKVNDVTKVVTDQGRKVQDAELAAQAALQRVGTAERRLGDDHNELQVLTKQFRTDIQQLKNSALGGHSSAIGNLERSIQSIVAQQMADKGLTLTDMANVQTLNTSVHILAEVTHDLTGKLASQSTSLTQLRGKLNAFLRHLDPKTLQSVLNQTGILQPVPTNAATATLLPTHSPQNGKTSFPVPTMPPMNPGRPSQFPFPTLPPVKQSAKPAAGSTSPPPGQHTTVFPVPTLAPSRNGPSTTSTAGVQQGSSTTPFAVPSMPPVQQSTTPPPHPTLPPAKHDVTTHGVPAVQPGQQKSTTFAVPTMGPVKQDTTTKIVAPTMPQVHQDKTTVMAVPTMPPVKQDTTTKIVVPTMPQLHHDKTTVMAVPTMPPVKQDTTTKMAIPTMPQVHQDKTTVMAVPTMLPIKQDTTTKIVAPTMPQVHQGKTTVMAVPTMMPHNNNNNNNNNNNAHGTTSFPVPTFFQPKAKTTSFLIPTPPPVGGGNGGGIAVPTLPGPQSGHGGAGFAVPTLPAGSGGFHTGTSPHDIIGGVAMAVPTTKQPRPVFGGGGGFPVPSLPDDPLEEQVDDSSE